MSKTITIGKTKVGGDHPCFVTAEVGINLNSPEDKSSDNGLQRGLILIEEAAKAGANGVKFQMFTAERMYPKGAGKYTIASGDKVDIWNVIKENELAADWVPKLKRYANDLNIECFITTCDNESTDVLASHSADAFKIASGELTHIPLLKHTARVGKPMIISTGGATIAEVAEAIEAIQSEGNNDIVVLHCVMQYPADLDGLNLSVIKTFKYAFPDTIVGWSDHSAYDSIAPPNAVVLGAKMVEKHFTLSRDLPGPDNSFAIEPEDLKNMVEAIRDTEKRMNAGETISCDDKLLGTSERRVYDKEKTYREFLYRTIFTIAPIKKGESFTSENISVLRPGEFSRGLDPKYYDLLVGKYTAVRDIEKDTVLTWDDVMG
jgi:sialic acid synthase SpsE